MAPHGTNGTPPNHDTSYNKYDVPAPLTTKQVSQKKSRKAGIETIFMQEATDVKYVPIYELTTSDIARIAQKSEVYIRKLARERGVGRVTTRGYLFDHDATQKIMRILEESAKRRAGKYGTIAPYETNVCWVLLKQLDVFRDQLEKIQRERSRDHLMFFEVYNSLTEWKETVNNRLSKLERG